MSTGIFLPIPANVRPVFSMDPHQAILQPNLLSFNSCPVLILLPIFLGIAFDRTLSFSKHASSLKAKFFFRPKASSCISASSWGSFKGSLFLLHKAVVRLLLNYALPGWLPFLNVANVIKFNRTITGCL